ncbi:unnamed protein product [Heterosigma akashiwo]|mmetsp:Transcript_9429/g.14897  ORF Transcript_9429/g.14897 Transcript_9429/m.14897 type:complete len:126 (-) Transcript_9429:307-684(-)
MENSSRRNADGGSCSSETLLVNGNSQQDALEGNLDVKTNEDRREPNDKDVGSEYKYRDAEMILAGITGREPPLNDASPVEALTLDEMQQAIKKLEGIEWEQKNADSQQNQLIFRDDNEKNERRNC